ncbi:MAG: hypothetical protein U0U46_09185 [Saprospiraceae bacterium]
MRTCFWALAGAALFLLGACSPATRQQAAPASQPPAQETETTEEYLEADGSLDSILQMLVGSGVVFDKTFTRLNPEVVWQQKKVKGECHLSTDLKYPGMTIHVDGWYPDCPPEPVMGSEISSLQLQFNDIPLQPDAHRYQISGDSVSLYWHYTGEWRKFRIGNEDWLEGSLDNKDCNGSFCMYNATLLVCLNGKSRGFYFFDHFPEPGLLADTDGDQQLEWLALDYGDWQQDTINLTVNPYELNNGKFRPLRDASGKPYEAIVRYSNGLYEPRGAQLVSRHWAR